MRELIIGLSILTTPTSVFAQEVDTSPPVAVPPVKLSPPVAPRTPCARGCLTPAEAVSYANELAPRAGVAGEFALTVKAVGEDRGIIYLNSEDDYRDQRNLSIDLPPLVARAFASDGELSALRTYFVGRKIAVLGVAGRVHIDFTTNDQPTGKYYFQTHVRVGSPSQIVDFPDQTSSTNRP